MMKHNKLINKKDIQTILKHAGHDLPSLESKLHQLSNAVLDLEIRKKELTFLHKCHIHADLLPNAVKILPRLTGFAKKTEVQTLFFNKCWTEDNETIEVMQSATEISIIDKAVSTYEE